MAQSDLLFWGQLLRILFFAILTFVSVRDLMRGENGLTIGLLLVALGNVVTAATTAYTAGGLSPQMNWDIITLATWTMDIGAGIIVHKLFVAAYQKGKKNVNP